MLSAGILIANKAATLCSPAALKQVIASRVDIELSTYVLPRNAEPLRYIGERMLTQLGQYPFSRWPNNLSTASHRTKLLIVSHAPALPARIQLRESVMMMGVFIPRHNFKILCPVIILDPVLVVNNLVDCQPPTKR
jgi:hypothetical protein